LSLLEMIEPTGMQRPPTRKIACRVTVTCAGYVAWATAMRRERASAYQRAAPPCGITRRLTLSHF
jgi:hypothetical protein